MKPIKWDYIQKFGMPSRNIGVLNKQSTRIKLKYLGRKCYILNPLVAYNKHKNKEKITTKLKKGWTIN